MIRINLNADLGESFGPWPMGNDDALLDLVDSANIACGFHAGDPFVMRRTVAAAAGRGVGIGAHPGFPDLQGFGRRRMEIPADELEAMLIYQIGALAAIARSEGQRISHVKPHGALNNMACADRRLAETVAAAIRRVDPGLILLAPVCSELARAGNDAGLPVVGEVFADRAYADDGSLVPRSHPGAVIDDADACLRHVLTMIGDGALPTIGGRRIPVKIESICVHGDGAEAVTTARTLRDGLAAAGCTFVQLPLLLGPAMQQSGSPT